MAERPLHLYSTWQDLVQPSTGSSNDGRMDGRTGGRAETAHRHEDLPRPHSPEVHQRQLLKSDPERRCGTVLIKSSRVVVLSQLKRVVSIVQQNRGDKGIGYIHVFRDPTRNRN